jgi:hypothetical protein
MYADERYKADHTFRNVVDILRACLAEYKLTPIAATMHEATHIQPLYYIKTDLPASAWQWQEKDWAYPAMFGGAPKHDFSIPAEELRNGKYETYYICSRCGISTVYFDHSKASCK